MQRHHSYCSLGPLLHCHITLSTLSQTPRHMSLDRHAVVRAPMERLGSLPTPIPTPPPPGAQPPLPPSPLPGRHGGMQEASSPTTLLLIYSALNSAANILCTSTTLHLIYLAPSQTQTNHSHPPWHPRHPAALIILHQY